MAPRHRHAGGPPGNGARPGSRRPDRRDALVGVERLIVDGSNLLHAVRRSTGPGPAPAATLIGRLRAAVPPAIRIELIFDGPAERGLGSSRIAAGLTVRHSGRATADALIVRLVGDATGASGSVDDARAAGQAILVVTDDGGLAESVRRRGARTARAGWLVRRLERPRLSSPSAGAGRPPAGPGRPPGSDLARVTAGEEGAADGDDDDSDDRRRWRPGRGATRKRGNPKRGSPKRGSPKRGRPG